MRIVAMIVVLIVIVSGFFVLGMAYVALWRAWFHHRFPRESEWNRKARLRKLEPWNPDHYVSCYGERKPL